MNAQSAVQVSLGINQLIHCRCICRISICLTDRSASKLCGMSAIPASRKIREETLFLISYKPPVVYPAAASAYLCGVFLNRSLKASLGDDV